MPAHDGWRQTRAAEQLSPELPVGHRFGTPGPDQGYALTLAARFVDRLQLEEDEHSEDAVAGALGIALRRAALYGRAPVIYDLELAFTILGFLGGAPANLVTFRQSILDGAGHDYWVQRDVADKVTEATLRLTPEQARDNLSDWASLFVG